MQYTTLAYYFIGSIDDPLAEVVRHKEFFATRDFRGRIYISEQGINGQSSGLKAHAEEYIAWLQNDSRFQGVRFKAHEAAEHAFPKMTVKYRRQLVAIDCPVDFSKRGTYVSPSEWKKMLEEKTDDTVLLDVRNDYEWEVGHFAGAELPQLETFRQFPRYAKELKEKCDPKTTPVMMYCTGGIRCEVFSSVLKQEGFEKVYQLEGGIIGYGLEEGAEHWEGNLFVFDDRLVVPVGKERGESIARCTHCQKPVDLYYNCANMDCNKLFVSCSECIPTHSGCCSELCCKEGRVRPFQINAKPFRKQCHCNTKSSCEIPV